VRIWARNARRRPELGESGSGGVEGGREFVGASREGGALRWWWRHVGDEQLNCRVVGEMLGWISWVFFFLLLFSLCFSISIFLLLNI
jgi:hypothetical protein